MPQQNLGIYSPEHDESQAEWVVRGCSGALWTLDRIVLGGFDTYLRIFHPGWRWSSIARTPQQALAVDDIEERKRATPVRWSDVAEERGLVIDRTTRWADIGSTAPDTRSGEGGITPPFEGETTPDVLDAVLGTLIMHGGPGQRCICAFWEGFGRFDRVDTIRIEGMGQGAHYLMSAALGDIREQWRLVLEESGEHSGLTPQALWPTGREWFFAVPFEMHSSFFGGTDDLASQIADSERLETREVFRGDRFLG